MSYHIGSRVLERLAGDGPRSQFADCIQHVLHGSQSADRMVRAGLKLCASVPSSAVFEEQVRELWAVDLNPLAQLSRQATSPLALVQVWNAYSRSRGVSTPLNLQGQDGTVRTALAAKSRHLILEPNMKVAAVLIGVISDTIRRSGMQRSKRLHTERPSISALARVLGQRHRITHEASLFFEAHPHANVAALGKALGCHPRTLERQFKAEGLAPRDLMRACALVGATHDLWGGENLAEIAHAHGYADQSHMSREISRSTGGLAPSFLRSLTHL